MVFATVLVLGAIAAVFLVLAGVLAWLDARAHADVPEDPRVRRVTVRQARFPRSIR
jgi:type IV secretory pathway TrbD component